MIAPIKGKWLPDGELTQFDYLHAIRAILARCGGASYEYGETVFTQLYKLADAGMNLPPPKQECTVCGGSGLTPGWVPTYSDPGNEGGHPEAEPCPYCDAWVNRTS